MTYPIGPLFPRALGRLTYRDQQLFYVLGQDPRIIQDLVGVVFDDLSGFGTRIALDSQRLVHDIGRIR